MKRYDTVKYGVNTYRLHQFYTVDYILLNLKTMIENGEYMGTVTAIQPKEEVLEVRDCPRCGCLYTGYPAISRKDNKTEICSDCGLAEAMNAFMKEVK